ncbi:MAG: tetratricopeptide repeat protein [Candidatus Heimdallarchaeota archaeon]|nr:tetratricopeptide repeat protein [Candidatus Heimdallarchaeota archaeon]
MVSLDIYDAIISNEHEYVLDQLEKTNLWDSEEGKLVRTFIYIFQEDFERAKYLLENVESTENFVELGKIVLELYINFRLRNLDLEDSMYVKGQEIIHSTDQMEDKMVLWAGYFYNIKALIQRSKGELQSAEKNFNESIKYRKLMANPIYHGMSLNNLASLFLVKGEYLTAKNYLKESNSIADTENNHILKEIIHLNLGITSYYLGEPDIAIKYLRLSLEQCKNKRNMAEAKLYLGLSHLDLNMAAEAEELLSSLNKMTEEIPSKEITLYNKIGQALLLKSKNRFSFRASSQKLLKEIVVASIIDVSITRLAMIHLADLYIEEYAIFAHDEPLKSLETLINSLYDVANHQNSIHLMIEVLIFQAKLDLIQSNISKYQETLNEALALSEKYNYPTQISKITELIETIDETSSKEKHDLLGYLDDLSSVVKKV